MLQMTVYEVIEKTDRKFGVLYPILKLTKKKLTICTGALKVINHFSAVAKGKTVRHAIYRVPMYVKNFPGKLFVSKKAADVIKDHLILVV